MPWSTDKASPESWYDDDSAGFDGGDGALALALAFAGVAAVRPGRDP